MLKRGRALACLCLAAWAAPVAAQLPRAEPEMGQLDCGEIHVTKLDSGAVLLTGDLCHVIEQLANRGVPSFNTHRADTLAAFDRFQAIARTLGATVIIEHEPADIARLPAFPGSAR